MRSPVTYNQDEQLAQVVTKFIKNKSDFDLDRDEKKNQAADAALKFMQKFTDNDGIFISFTKMDSNNWIYQLNFRIS